MNTSVVEKLPESEVAQILDGIGGWVGWELWEVCPDSIVLDGDFTLLELRAIVAAMMRHKAPAVQ